MFPGTLPRILIVDDEPVVRQTLERALAARYDVSSLPSSECLEETIRRFPPDLIILDVRMPGLDGTEVCHRLRRDKRYDTVPVMFLSACSDEATVRKGFANGADFYMPKPFDLNELHLTVEALIGRKHHHPDDDPS
jgi:DNA-binding response OmpR family regulator